jgi:hypothetical protein
MFSLSKFATIVFGSGLALLGLYILLSGGVSLPTRQPPKQFHFRGLSLFLLGMSPLVAGLLSLALARGVVHRESRFTQFAIGTSIIALGLAFVLATKG